MLHFLFMVHCCSLSSQIDVLPEVVRAVSGRVEVFMDGGVRQGTDVLKALAMGAKAVFVGRPVLWGLAYKVGGCCSLMCFHISVGLWVFQPWVIVC